MKKRICLMMLGWMLPFGGLAELTNKVLVIGIDGTMPPYLLQARTPNLDLLRSNGCYSYRAVTHPVTHSAACWTAMFTGVWGDKNGVNDLNNGFYGTRFDLYPNFLRRLEMVNSNWNTAAYLRWSPLATALAGADVVQSFGSDEALMTATCQRLTNSNPDVFYTILLDVDSAGHSPGWGSATYVQAIETADRRVGQIVNALTKRTSYTNENWLIIVLSDHGKHDDPDIEKSRVTFHIISGRDAARGEMLPSPSIVDVCATVLTHMRVPLDPAWNLDARVEGLASPRAQFGTNLVFNGNGEFNSGTNNYYINDDNQKIDRGIAWWFDAGMVTLGQYGTHSRFPSQTSGGPTNRGNNFFLGGLGTNNQMTQTIDVTNLGSEIDDPGADYVLSGFLGGAGTNSGNFTLAARFLDASRAPLATNVIGPVTAADRTNVTCLLERTASGRVPPGCRAIQFMLTARSTTQTNDASADELSLVLTSLNDSPLNLSIAVTESTGARISFMSQTNRVYLLQRTENFASWADAGGEIAGSGNELTLTDPNPPPGYAFYRVRSRKP